MRTYEFPATTTGIYHLMKDGQVMYVGQSTNVLSRVASWIRPGVHKFDGWRFFPCDAAYLDAEELRHIREYDPPLNAEGRTCRYKGGPRRQPPAPPPTIEQIRQRLSFKGDTVPGEAIRACGLELPNRDILNLADFPEPIYANKVRGGFGKEVWRCRWRRDEVLNWFERRAAA